MRLYFLILGIFLCVGCTEPTIRARTFYTSRADLASFVIDTPDPEKSTKGLGQVIWVSWSCPSLEEGTTTEVTLRFKNGEERHESYVLDQRVGWRMVEITPEERDANDGLLSYLIEIRRNGAVLASTQHKLWVEKIVITN